MGILARTYVKGVMQCACRTCNKLVKGATLRKRRRSENNIRPARLTHTHTHTHTSRALANLYYTRITMPRRRPHHSLRRTRHYIPRLVTDDNKALFIISPSCRAHADTRSNDATNNHGRREEKARPRNIRSPNENRALVMASPLNCEPKSIGRSVSLTMGRP